MDDQEKIRLALKHIREPFYFVELNDREREAVRLASRGFSIPKIIAPRMGVTPKSVYQFLKSAAYKISVWTNKDVKFHDLNDLMLRLVEGVLRDE